MAPSGVRGTPQVTRLVIVLSVARLGLDIGPFGGVGDRPGQTFYHICRQWFAWGWISALAGVSGTVSGKPFLGLFVSGWLGAGYRPLRGRPGPSRAKRLLPLVSVVRLGLDTGPFRGCQGSSRANRFLSAFSAVRLGLDSSPCGCVGDRPGQSVCYLCCQWFAWGWIPGPFGGVRDRLGHTVW